MSRPTKATIDLNALRQNYLLAKQLAPNANTLAVVKANAYGHGAIEVAQALESLAPVLAVSCTEEAVELRQAGIKKPILLLEGPFTADEIELASRENFWLMIVNTQQLKWVANSTHPLRLWLKADTGMHRLGFTAGELIAAYKQLKTLTHINNDVVIATHFAAADALNSDFTQQQIDRFTELTKDLQAPLSMANSAGILEWQASHSHYNRPGIMLYGSSPFDQSHPQADKLQPVMTLTSEVIALRDINAGDTVGYGRDWVAQKPSRIATVAVGYGDGYPRHASSGTPVWLNGQRVELAGRVSMDMITLDVSNIDNVTLGTPVELWGKNLPVDEVARRANTIGYELLTRMPSRTKRIYMS